jgi:Ni/Fe-hydrogenase subunit HybB-like protein
MTAIRNYLYFLWRCLRIAFVGDWRYYAWMGVLTVIILLGLHAYLVQLSEGLATTGMTNQVSWGVYIANFTFLVGIAAAAVMLVIPVYIYRNRHLHDLVIFGELLAVAAILMCLAFVTVDLGRPDKALHMLPVIGKLNFPGSMLAWDVVVLNGYLLLNLHIIGYLLYCRYQNKSPRPWFYIPFVFVAIAWAISIHTVTAFLFVGLGGKDFWSQAIVGPRFIASAFAGGPALIILALQVIRRVSTYQVRDEALLTLRSIVQVAMLINVFLLANEFFKKFYTDTTQGASAKYLYFGIGEYNALVPWIWTALVLNIVALVILMLPVSRSLRYLNVACVSAIVGIWIEKGMGLVVPGFVPTPIGEIVEYMPTMNETLISFSIWAFGFLAFTIFLRMSIPILQGSLNKDNEPGNGRGPASLPKSPEPEPAEIASVSH